ncbi:vanadium-dependent haloperoxidase [Flavisericum labens]|uniref:vanadium-dependent haloperoxidase n=1 Tax=Flavisericum labens TaxID=3377112 RepID=UPI00387ABCEA
MLDFKQVSIKYVVLKRAFLLVTMSWLLISISGCEEDTRYKNDLNNPELFRMAMKKLTDVIVYDIFSPPVASRVYMYPSLASYAIIQKKYPEKYNSLVGQVTDFKDIPEPSNKNIDLNLASLQAFFRVGKALVFSEDKLTEFQESCYDSLSRAGLPEKVLEASMDYGDKVADHILKWADTDFYKQTRTYPQYIIREEPQYWKPTPPAYMQGIEPHWNKIRTLVLQAPNQFVVKPPFEFDLTDGSPFKKQLMEVYEVGGKDNCKGADIAKFWDCNPYVAHHQGHTMFATKKITPGGHWVGITSIATKIKGSTFDETVNAFTNVSVALFDGFISCWDQKWNTLVVRPETVINKSIDEDWEPFLQTPPFPEYTSGHSVISGSAAVVLTQLFGDNFGFEDTTETEYGLPARTFTSFIQASEEAALSRLYGGIHYNMAITEGLTQGKLIGHYIADNLKTLKVSAY